MNPLQNLVADELVAQKIKRSELCKRMGYSNISKCLRKLDAMLETLEHREWLLPLLQDALKIPDERFYTAVSALEDEIFEEQSAVFKPSIWVLYSIKLSVFGAWGRTRFIEVPENVSSLGNEMEIVGSLCRVLADKNDVSTRKGFIYHRHHGESIVMDNHLNIVKK